jgi:hypothetical protein
MSQWIRKLLGGQPMSRREFLSGTAGAAAAAAATKVPVPTSEPVQQTARSLARSDILPPAFRSGFELPGGGYIIGRDGKAMVWGEGDWHFLSKQALAKLQDTAKQAAASLPSMPSGGPPVYYNALTRQWHPMVTLPAEEAGAGLRRVEYGKSGVDVPQENWSDEALYFDEDFGPMSQSDGTLTTPGADYWDKAGKRAGVNQIEGITREWEQGQKALAEYYREHPPQTDDSRRAHRQVLDNLGHYPGGWHNVGPDPFKSEPWSMTTGGLEGYERPAVQSATSGHNIRKMLGRMAPAVAVGAAAGSQERKSPATKELLK